MNKDIFSTDWCGSQSLASAWLLKDTGLLAADTTEYPSALVNWVI